MKSKITMVACVVGLLSGCSDSMYDKCISAEVIKLNELNTYKRYVKHSEFYSPYYNVELDSNLEKLKIAGIKEAEGILKFKLENLYNEDNRAFFNNIDELERNPELADLVAARDAYRRFEIDRDSFLKVITSCDEKPTCTELLSTFYRLDNEKNDLILSANKLEDEKFQFFQLSLHLGDSLERQLVALTFDELISILPDTDASNELKLKLAKHKGSDKISKDETRSLIRYFLATDIEEALIDRVQEAGDPFPYLKALNNIKELRSSGAYAENIAQRLDVFIKGPKLERVAMQTCNERGLYE